MAGSCDISGFADGQAARFNLPRSLAFDKRNPGRLLITDFRNNALRFANATDGVVGTVIRTGFNRPRGLAWHNERLLVCNENYISEVVWDVNGAVSNKRLTIATGYGYRDGAFSLAQFSIPVEIQQISPGFFLIADHQNRKLRLLDMFRRKVLPVCDGSLSTCTRGTALAASPNSLLVSNGTVYIGGHPTIFKLTG